MRKLIDGVGVLVVCTMAACGNAVERMELWPEGKTPSFQKEQNTPYLEWHTPKELKSTAILIAVSGGGYNGNGIDGFEVAPMRDYMLEKGITVVTMLYRTPRPKNLPKHFTAWQDAQRTVRIVRNEAKRRGLDPDNIGFTGCSAGGHLAVMAAVSSLTSAYEPVDELDALPCNVNWALPVYPAYLLADGIDRHNAGKGNDLSVGFAPELKFDAATPPMCFFHGDVDGWSAMGSVRAYHKLRTMGIPAELHTLALEDHCFQSNPRPDTPAAIWKDIAWAWLVSIDAVTGHPAVWKNGWTSPVAVGWTRMLSDFADFETGVWETEDWRNAVLTAEKDGILWLRGDWVDFVLDFEYKFDSIANTDLVIHSRTVKIPQGRTKLWNRMTVWSRGRHLKVILNGTLTVDEAAVSSTNTTAACSCGVFAHRSIGFRSGHGGVRSRFRNVRIKQL